ncbi:MAG: TonB family protein, partial [Myxococcota bacterium]
MTGVLVAVLLCVALALAPAAACAQGNTGVAQPRVQVLTKPPQLLRSVEAVYPKAALDAGVEGDVVLKVTIDAEGRVVEASVLRGPEPLHQPALAAVRQFVFSPAEVNGAPAPVTLPFTLTFELPQLPAAIAGVIRDPTGEPRAGITLVVVPEGASVTDASQRRVTGADGAFDLEDLEPGSWELIARDAAAGEELGRVVVRLESGKRARVVFTLEEFEAPVGVEPELEERGGEEENRVTTRAQRDVRSTTKRRLSLEEVRLIPGARGDVVRVVQNLPGVARPRLGTGDFVVRGAAPQDTLILLEGDVVPGVFHFLGGPAVLQPEMIETIEFYPGNFDVQYGRATAGVLNLRSRVPRADTFHGFAKVDLIDSTLMLEGPVPGIDGLSIALSGRRSYLDALLSPLIDERSAGFVVPRYYDYQGWITYEGVRHHTISLQIYGSNDKLRLLGSTGAPEPEEQMSQQQQEDEEEAFGLTNGFHRGQVRWSWDPVGPVRNELSVSFGVSG